CPPLLPRSPRSCPDPASPGPRPGSPPRDRSLAVICRAAPPGPPLPSTVTPGERPDPVLPASLRGRSYAVRRRACTCPLPEGSGRRNPPHFPPTLADVREHREKCRRNTVVAIDGGGMG